MIALSFGLHALVYGMLGIFLGARFQKNRSPILTAGLIVFSGYGISAFSRTIDNHLLTFLSPFSFFEPALIHANGSYESDYLIWYVLLVIVLPIFAHRSLLKQDISMAV